MVIRMETARYALDRAEGVAYAIADLRLAAQLRGLRLIVEDLIDIYQGRRETIARRP